MNFEDLLVSGAPAQIYALPGSLFEFHQVADPDRATAAGISHLFELYPANYYRHTAHPDMIVDSGDPWSEHLLESYNAEKHCHCAASVVLLIEDAIIDHSAIYCRKNDHVSILYETFRAPDRAAIPLSMAALEDVSLAPFQRADRTYLYVGSAGSFNYGHWLVDDLPRAKAWLELRRRSGIDCVVVMPSHGAQMNDVRVRSLRTLIHPLIEVEFIAPDQPCRIANLHFATPVSFHPRIKNPAAIHFVRSRAVANLPEPEGEPSRRLFVARRPPNSRAIINFDGLWTFLEARDFELVEAEDLDFAGQVSLFQNAGIVVGQMGAAMTNTLFCRPATTLIYLAPNGWAEPFYLDLAALGGQHYNILSGPPASQVPPYLSDFTVPVDQLYHRLTYMGVLERAPT